ncbi:ABC transporter permease [Clostridium minihomine]|uniref:ABC transporter permease n=1 Tax=Clostridium minihomine TaxID=2045012 RepID=UPI000C75CB0C|nr:ABC transporter permease [Clostridium minihomine]
MVRAKYITEVIGRMFLVLFAVSILSFLLVTQSPIDPLVSYVGVESTLSEAAKAQIAEYWGLNAPLPQRYLTWLTNVFHGDFGMSITYKRPVIEVIGERFSYSIVLMALAWFLSGILGFVLGILSGIKQGSLFDKVTKVLCLGLQSAPSFWLGLLILSFFSVTLGWFPIGMAAPVGKLASQVTLADRAYHLVLPVFTLTIVSISKVTLYTRQKLIEIMASDFILFARARGESTKQLVFRHAIRNIALPAITVQFTSFSELFGGMALAETVFSYPGIGTATTAAALKGDVPLLLGIALFSALFVFAGNLTANLLYGILDPRIKEGGYVA